MKNINFHKSLKIINVLKDNVYKENKYLIKNAII